MATYQNPGLLFNKHYFKDINFRDLDGNSNETLLKNNNNDLLNSLFNTHLVPKYPNTRTIELITVYPGLFSGSGYGHEISVKGEIKLGFYFDHTTGLPVIPGSSVKGVLRSAFEKDNRNYIKYLLKEELEIENTDNINIADLEQNIFEGTEGQSLYKKDIFFDAFPVATADKDEHFLGNDYITPHENPLKNPIPLQFLKILPQVTFRFSFDLKDFNSESGNGLKAEQKLQLFKQILLDLGIGAKTNVGYGQFVLNKEENESRESYKKPSLAEIKQENAEKEANKTEAERRIVKGARLKCNVVEITNREVFFMFDWDKELKFTKKRMKLNVELKINNIIEIEIVEDFYVFRKVLFSNSVTIIQ